MRTVHKKWEDPKIWEVAPVQQKGESNMNEIMKKAHAYAEQHKSVYDTWEEGEIINVWKDENGTLCIRYESGKWWHYRERSYGEVEWW